ncbi:MAG: small basic family protein [Anaerotignum sp.]|nr:small basic family protein [Anaerotignum sp.]MBQ3615819.1 small basic family protein [Anaerotignum sp.]MBQ7084323.1 small basic family protein [Anaerotignum sp.]MBR2061831.1 small basic family protein [Anaerotignum sp.]MBR2383546.1 small basic family protein [Anaerotignum sp.]
MLIPIIGLFVGVAAGIYSGLVFPAGYSAYVAVGILACLDSVLGGVYANMRDDFRWKVFATGFVLNAVLAMVLIWLGNQLSIDLSIAAVVVYGSRMFNNFSNIRHLILNKNEKQVVSDTE